MRPAIVVMPNSQGGIGCCGCFRCCTCVNVNFLKTEIGVVKTLEVLLGMICHSLVLNFGTQYALTIGSSYQSFLTTASWSFLTTGLLILCYLLSPRSLGLIRQSLFETAFNGIAAFSYITSCSYLGYAVNMFLQPLALMSTAVNAYPAVSTAYILGSFVGLLYLYDAWKSWTYYRNFI
ncbi:protein singles bar [Coccinella septempunctata]|uniref:protein singles bar n=1 Tax=Coccinella septempunctata TaxID=41139 RepID=UPI001D099252|nr:protein singles bar [Coccinella septempunctata]